MILPPIIRKTDWESIIKQKCSDDNVDKRVAHETINSWNHDLACTSPCCIIPLNLSLEWYIMNNGKNEHYMHVNKWWSTVRGHLSCKMRSLKLPVIPPKFKETASPSINLLLTKLLQFINVELEQHTTHNNLNCGRQPLTWPLYCTQRCLRRRRS